MAPAHTAPVSSDTEWGEGLPKDVIVVDWAYGGRTHADLKHLQDSAAYFVRKLGLKVITAAWDDPFNITRLSTMGRSFGPSYQGVMHCSWEDRGPAPEGRLLTAQGAWQGATMLGEFSF